MSNSWKSVSVESICLSVTDCDHSTPVFTDTGYVVVRTKNIKNGKFVTKELSYTDSEHYNLRTRKAKPVYGDIIITREAPVGEVCLVPSEYDVCLGQRMVLLKPNIKMVIPKYFKYALMSQDAQNKIKGEANGSTVSNLRIPILKNLNIPLPPLPEQKKIAEILGSWDTAIEQLETLIEKKQLLKRGLMQKLLSGKVRFPEFEGINFKTLRFHEVFDRVTRKNTVGNQNILTISGSYGLVNQQEFFKKRVASENLNNYYLIYKGEFAYNKSYSNGYPMGAIKRLERYEAGVVSSLYLCFAIKSEVVDSDFLSYYFESGIFNIEIYSIAQEGARNHGLLNVSAIDFFETVLHVPPLDEQKKVAGIFKILDSEISNLSQQLEALKTQKLGLMQQLLTGKVRVQVDEPTQAI